MGRNFSRSPRKYTLFITFTHQTLFKWLKSSFAVPTDPTNKRSLN